MLIIKNNTSALGSENFQFEKPSNPTAPPSKGELLLFPRKAPAEVEDGGVVALDLDEAFIGIYLIADNTVKVATEGSLDALYAGFNSEGERMCSAPLQWMRDQVTPTNWIDAGIGFGVSGLVLPFSMTAAVGGFIGTREALNNHDLLPSISHIAQ